MRNKLLDSVTGLLAIMLVGTMCYLALCGKEIPGPLAFSVATVVAFFFVRAAELLRR